MGRIDGLENQELRLNATGRNYYVWLMDKIHIREHSENTEMVAVLFDREYLWFLENDDNRAEEGLDLRDQYEQETGYPISEYKEIGLNIPCSVLEMLIGLAQAIENNVMYDPERGNRTHIWFWEMVRNLGLDKATDDEILGRGRFGVAYIDGILDRWLAREFDSDGVGSPFPLSNCGDFVKNQRETELWFQAMNYLNERYL